MRRVVLAAAISCISVACGGDAATNTGATGTAAAWLAEHPQIAAALVWDAGDGNGPRPYASWSAADKAALQSAVDLAARSGDPGFVDPPTNLVANILPDESSAVTVLAPADARKIYFTYVGRSLHLEMSNALPWSIAGYTAAELAVLLDSRAFFTWKRNVAGTNVTGYTIYDAPTDDIATDDPRYANGWVIPAAPAVVQSFLDANHLLGPTRLATIERLLQWEHEHLVHFSGGFTLDGTFFHWQYRGAPPVSRIISGTTTRIPPPVLRHYIGGCPGSNMFLAAVLRAVNIPVQYVVVEEHATPVFSTEGKALSHGDDPYSGGWQSQSNPLPASALLIDKATFDRWFSPTLSHAERLAGIGRQVQELALSNLSDWVLRERCTDVAAGDPPHAASRVFAFFSRIYTVQQLEAASLWTRLDAKIGSLGGCTRVPPRS